MLFTSCSTTVVHILSQLHVNNPSLLVLFNIYILACHNDFSNKMYIVGRVIHDVSLAFECSAMPLVSWRTGGVVVPPCEFC